MDLPAAGAAHAHGGPKRPDPARLRVGEITQRIFELERRLGLLEQRIGGVHWWPLLRVETFYRLARSLGVLDEARPDLARRRARRPRGRFWERAGLLRAKLAARRSRARLADALIAQSCIDHDVRLITRDSDFRHFARVGGLRLAL